MRTTCPLRPAAACRLIASTLVLLVLITRSAAADVAGTVVDEAGRAVPRAQVRIIDGAGTELAVRFSDASGRFEVITSRSDCRIEAHLTGFLPATAGCEPADQPVRLVLVVAPIEETILVTATRTEAPTSQAGVSATVFTADDLARRQTPFLADLLASTPGVMVVRNGPPGALTSLFVRGGESDYTKVLLDGVPLNEPGGGFFLNNLTTEGLERVEIVRGAHSSLFGSDAMASVIQLFTRRADRASRRPQFSAHVDGGTYRTFRASAGISGGTDRFDYVFDAARFDSDNRVPNSAFENTTLSGNVGVGLGNRATIRFVGRAEIEHTGTPGPTAFGRPDLDAFFDRDDIIASVSIDDGITSDFRQRASYSVAASNQQSINRVADPAYTATDGSRIARFASSDFLYDSRTDLTRHHAGYQADWRLSADARRGDQLLTLLADWDGERAALDDRLGGTRTVNSRDNFGVAAQHQVLWPRVFLTVGGRLERNQDFGIAAVPRATAAFVVRRASGRIGETQIKASGGAGIKEPTMLESFSLSPFFRGNPDLEPERSRSLEIGVSQRAAHDRARVEVTYFDNRFRDIITLVTTDPATFEAQYENVGVTRARGVEIGVEAAPLAAVRTRGSYTLLDSKIIESASPDHPLFGLGREAFRRPRHSGSAGVSFTWARVEVDFNGTFVGSFVDSDFGLFSPPLQENPGYELWDSRLAVTVAPGVAATLAIDNLTDEDYSVPFGYQALQRVVRTGIRVRF
jgi:vitamin B12 transporter